MIFGTKKDCADEDQQEFPGLDWTEITSKSREVLPRVSAISELINQYSVQLQNLVVRVPGYRSRFPCSIPDATRLSQK
jgi:hypothetical protein